jgi:putative Mn2+ efflux pump MntP
MGTLLAILVTVFLIATFGWPAFIILTVIGLVMVMLGA